MEEGLAYVWKRIGPLIRSRVSVLFARSPSEGVARGQGGVMESPPIHPVLETSVSFLLGTWRGEGEGGFPTIKSFKYGEEIKLWHVGKAPFEFFHVIPLRSCACGVEIEFPICTYPFRDNNILPRKELEYAIEAMGWKPMMAYTQRTWKAASGEPMHAESGFFRPKPDGSIEVVIAQGTGLAEVQKGTYDFDKKTLELRSSLVGNASKVVEITRKFTVEGDELRYSVDMATHTHELQPHLHAVLKKVS